MTQLADTDDPQRLAAIIAEDYPGVITGPVRVLQGSWDHLVLEVGDEYIFRFPTEDDGRFEPELKLLERLRGKVNVTIPEVSFIGNTVRYMGYRKIPGVYADARAFQDFSKREQERFIDDIAEFLAIIHAEVTPEDARALGLPDDDGSEWTAAVKRALPRLPASLQRFGKATLREYEDIMASGVEKLFLHNDIHHENMMIDPGAHRLAGIFDFTDACVGDVACEFRWFYSFDPKVLKAVIRQYSRRTGRHVPFRRAVIHERMAVLGDLDDYYREQNRLKISDSLRRLSRWSMEADIAKVD